MLLYLMETLKRLRVDELRFFTCAHYWAFQTTPDLTDDVRIFRETGFIPRYVQSYLNYIKNETT